MRLSATFCITALLAIGLITTPARAATPDDAATGGPTSNEPAAIPESDPDNPAVAAQSPYGPPVDADSDCLIVLRNTKLFDVEQEIDPRASVTWIATDAERETPEKCRSIGAR